MAWAAYTFRMLDSRADSDADYRTIGKWISDRLTDLGWAKTADTGQIDWSTATRPGAPTVNTKGGYEIRKSTVASADIYLKISYGLGYTTSCFGLWITTGDGSDGAGTLTGDQTTEQQAGSYVTATSPYEATWFVCGDASNFVIAAADSQTATAGFVCGVQRTCDASGVDTATGYYMFRAGYSAAQKSTCQYCSFAGGVASADDSPGFATLYLPRTVMTTGSVQCLPLYAQNGLTWAPLRDVCAQYGGSVLCDFEAPLYGATRRYKGAISTVYSGVWGYTAVLAQSIGVRLS